jgi:CHAT domain-containing protein
LNNLNFETLLVPGPKLHYWIEDVTISYASSLRVLAAKRPSAHTSQGRLMLIGDPVVPDAKYPSLPEAATEIEKVEASFPQRLVQVYKREAATPLAYLNNKPEQYSYIHFVAHGTASQLSPLDSAIVLSKATVEEDSFKLHARDIIGHPLNADLVTISACYGSGSTVYNGEGLVGLAWGFVRAGAHGVVGALWAVSDKSTSQVMGRFYSEIRNGRRPEDALRNAKLSLLHSDTIFRTPI